MTTNPVKSSDLIKQERELRLTLRSDMIGDETYVYEVLSEKLKEIISELKHRGYEYNEAINGYQEKNPAEELRRMDSRLPSNFNEASYYLK